MAINTSSKAILLCAAILGLSAPVMAYETSDSAPAVQKLDQQKAVILQIEQTNVTLQPLGDKTQKVTAPFANAAEFKVGDTVTISGNTLKKAETVLDKTQPGEAGTKTN